MNQEANPADKYAFLRPDYQQNSPLVFGLPMLNPLDWQPKIYVKDVVIGVNIADEKKASLALDKYVFIYTKTTVALKDVDAVDQDFNYLVDVWSIQRNFISEPARPDVLFGNPFTGALIPWDAPIFIDEGTSISMRVINQVVRTGENFVVQFAFHGFEYWGDK